MRHGEHSFLAHLRPGTVQIHKSEVGVCILLQSQTRDATPSNLATSAPPCRPAAEASVTNVPLVPLIRSLAALLALPNPSPWLIRTVKTRLCDSVCQTRPGSVVSYLPLWPRRMPPSFVQKFRGANTSGLKKVTKT